MVSLKSIVALSCLCAVASVFYMTAYKMNTHLNVSSAVASITSEPITPHQRITEASKNSSETRHAAMQPVEAKTPDKETVVIPDSALVGIVTNDATSVVSENYQYSFGKLASNLHTRTNIARSQNKLSHFTYDEALAKLATKRSADMAVHNYFSHTSPDGCDLGCRFKKAEYVTLSYGENLAEYSDYETLSESNLAESFINMWLESDNHRKNLLSKDYTNEGIGVAVNGKRIIVTIIFAKS